MILQLSMPHTDHILKLPTSSTTFETMLHSRLSHSDSCGSC